MNNPPGPDQPSRTSIVVASLRAFGARETDTAVQNPDWLAERLISRAELELITANPIAHALHEDYETGSHWYALAKLDVLRRL